jgi:hypothetical protein
MLCNDLTGSSSEARVEARRELALMMSLAVLLQLVAINLRTYRILNKRLVHRPDHMLESYLSVCVLFNCVTTWETIVFGGKTDIAYRTCLEHKSSSLRRSGTKAC